MNTYNVIVDVILVVIMVFGIVFGVKNGFVAFLSKPIRFFAALATAILLASSVGNLIVMPLIEEPVTNQIVTYLETKCIVDNKVERIPTLLKLAATLVGVDVSNLDAASAQELIELIVDKLAMPVVELLSLIVAFIALYFISKLLYGLIFGFISNMFNHGIIGFANKTIGFVFGFLFTFIISWAVVLLFGYIISIPQIASTSFASSFTGGWIYNFYKSVSPVDLLLSF